MALFGKLQNRWRIAKIMAEAEASGEALIRVPGALAAQVKSYAWHLKVETASDRWATDVYDVPLEKWQATLSEAGRRATHADDKPLLHWEGEIPVGGRHRAARPRRWPGSKVLPVIRTPTAV